MRRFLFIFAPLLMVLAAPNATRAASTGTSYVAPQSNTGFDSDTLSYISRSGVTNTLGQNRLDGFVKAMKLYGLWSIVYDVVPMSSFMQPSNGNDLVSMKGKFTTLYTTNGPLRGFRGIAFDGVDDRIYGVTADTMSTFTLAVNLQGATNNSGTPTSFQFLNSGLTEYSEVSANSAAYDMSYYQSVGNGGGAVSYTLIHYEVGGPFPGYTHMDALRKNVTIAQDNTGAGTSMAWVNGARTLFAGPAVTRTFTTGASVISIGCRINGGTPLGFFKGNAGSLVLFNSKLTDTQASNLVQCVRWLDPVTENIVVLGDSLSDQQNPAGNYAFWESWPSALEQFPAMSNRFWIVNNAYNGVAASTFNYDYAVKPFAPGRGGVERGVAIIFLGYNDMAGGALGTAIFSSLNSLASRARADGFEVGIVTQPMGRAIVSGSGSISTTNYQTYAGMILSNRENFNFVLRLDSVVGSTNQPNVWNSDGVHFLGPGQETIAKSFNDIMNTGEDIGEAGYWTQSITNSGAAATDLLFRSQPPNELRKSGDNITYTAFGGFTNETTLAKLVTLKYGSEEICNSGNMALHRGPWTIRAKIRMINPLSQVCVVDFSSVATNFSQVTFTTQTNFVPTIIKVVATAPSSGCVTNNGIEWAY